MLNKDGVSETLESLRHQLEDLCRNEKYTLTIRSGVIIIENEKHMTITYDETYDGLVEALDEVKETFAKL